MYKNQNFLDLWNQVMLIQHNNLKIILLYNKVVHWFIVIIMVVLNFWMIFK